MVIITRPRDVSDPFYRPQAQDYSHAYTSILAASRRAAAASTSLASSGDLTGSSTVLILSALDVDALCATKSLVSLFTEDEIAYRVVPVDGYSTLDAVIREDVVDNLDLHTVIFVNLGSLLSMPNYFTTSSNPDPDSEAHILPPLCTIHLIDSHRPYNLDNLFATSELVEKICVWDDGEIEERLGKEAKAYAELEFYDDEGSDSDSEVESETDVSEEEEGEDEEGRGRPKRKRAEDGEDDGAGSETGSVARASQRPRIRRKRARSRRIDPDVAANYQAVLNRYYNRGTYTSMSVASIMFMLAEKLGRSDNETLWLAILGLTSQYLSSAIAHGHYDELSSALATDVVAMNKAPSNVSVSQADKLLGKPVNADDGRIRVIPQELRFSLYRHWSLENSMYHSSYVAGKLGIWRELGLSKLRGLMAKMGLSLQQCRQTFEHMDLDLRETLCSRIESIAPEYGLTECVYRSFLRSFGYRNTPISAGDAVEGLEALLSAAHGVRIEVDAPGLTFGGVGAGVGGVSGAYEAVVGRGMGDQGSELFGSRRLWNLGLFTDGEQSDDKENRPPHQMTSDEQSKESSMQQERASSRQASWVRNYFTAYTALDTRKTNNVRLMQSSLSLSKALHRAVVSQGVALIDKQAIRTLRNFRLAILQDGPQLSLFTDPNLLIRLGAWLVSALRDIVKQQEDSRRQKKRKKANNEEAALPTSLPFVLASLDESRNRYIVVGINGSREYGDVVRNRFGLAFQEAAAKSGARTRHDRFETCAVEVGREDLAQFVESIHAVA